MIMTMFIIVLTIVMLMVIIMITKIMAIVMNTVVVMCVYGNTGNCIFRMLMILVIKITG